MTARRIRPLPLYPHSAAPRLPAGLFRRPTGEYRGAPFWSWNTRLDERQLLRQIDRLADMGFGGFHMHARTGLATEYLGSEFLDAVARCTAHARRRRLRAWLYDEDRWPSGFAGGLVSRDPALRERTLRWTTRAEAPSPEAHLLARYAVKLQDGRLQDYRRLPTGATPRGSVAWHAWLQIASADPWFNGQSYINTFDRRAVERFLRVTHERYFSRVGGRFGSTIPAVFTDEPHFFKKSHLRAADSTEQDVIIPFAPDFFESYARAYGHRLEDRLPELFWNLPDDRPSRARWCYHDHTAERFAAAFGDTIARWCTRHGIRLTGHMLSEATLYGQTRAVGEVMRGLRSFQLPGVDVLEDKLEFTTVKQAQSLARQFGREGVTSELYGVTGWDFDFTGHKRHGDWQAAMGVTLRVPHLAWVSMTGEAKRDYPAAIDYHSPWYREYPLVEDHFARLNTVLTRGTPIVRVAVIHPIESFWLAWGPADQCSGEWGQRETAFRNVTEWLSHGLIDFDFVSESNLSRLPVRTGRPFAVGKMRYDAVIVPGLRTIRRTTLRRLEQFAGQGGTIAFVGEIPSLVDAAPSQSPARLASRCRRIEWSRDALIAEMRPFRDVSIRMPDGADAATLLYQMRQDGKRRHVFFCNVSRTIAADRAQVRIAGHWKIEVLDTITGKVRPLPAEVNGGVTMIGHSFPPAGHLLISMTPIGKRRPAAQATRSTTGWTEVARLRGPVRVTLAEPNVLLLDQAEWRIDEGSWQPTEEILRIDNALRSALGLPERGGRMRQPWTDPAPAPVLAQVQLRFTIICERPIAGARLALEGIDHARVRLNGRDVATRDSGWWVDESIRTMSVPRLRSGANELLISIAFSRTTDLEWAYLLGDFSVALAGRHARLGSPVRRLAFGDWTTQGLPFYAGNLTYHCEVRGDRRAMTAEVAHFRNPLLTATLDGRALSPIAFPPYRTNLGRFHGRRKLEITAYGNRHNAFGPLHHTRRDLTWIGPAAWRSTGASWSYEYVLKPMGILSAPIVYAALPTR